MIVHQRNQTMTINKVADNVDATVTGKGTFHEMGIICVDSKPTGSFGNIPRLKDHQPTVSFRNSRAVEIVPYQIKYHCCFLWISR